MPEDDRAELAEDRTDYAEHRTDYAEDRTILANLRTFGAYTRTGLGAVAVALGVQALLREISPDWPGKVIATTFCGCAVLLFVGGFVDFIRTPRARDSHELKAPPVWTPAVLSTALSLAAASMAAAFWLYG